MLLRMHLKRRGDRAVHHVVRDVRMRVDILRNVRQFACHACRGRVDQHIEALPGEIRVARHVDRRCERRGDGMRLLDGAIGNDQTLRLFAEQRADHTTRSAARADQQNSRAMQHDAVVGAQIAHQPNAVGVIAVNALFVEAQGIHRARSLGPRRTTGCQFERLLLERYRDIQTAPACDAKRFHGLNKAVERRKHLLVGQRLQGLPREFAMNVGRFTVRDRIADHGVTVGHGVVSRLSR